MLEARLQKMLIVSVFLFGHAAIACEGWEFFHCSVGNDLYALFLASPTKLIYVHEHGIRELYAKVVMEIGHHHHHGLQPLGLPLEIVPSDYSHARMGESYEIQVLQNGQPLAGAEVKVTYASTRSKDYPHHLTTSEDGRTKIFLSARGNYLFSVATQNITSTFTLVKSF